VAAWVDAPLSDGSRPSLATRHNRRSAASAGFRILRDLGLVDHDPTVDVGLPLRSRGRNTRPLTDDEVAAGRAASVGTLSATRLPAVWALAEATATTHEIPRVLPCHVDLDGGTVVLGGSAKTEPRTATVTDWGISVLARRLDLVGPTDRSLTYQGKGSAASMQASSSMAIARILNEAGLRGERSVKPESVRAWAGHRIWVETGRIESAATALGCRSLDTTARIVGYQWAELA
jgi:integrase